MAFYSKEMKDSLYAIRDKIVGLHAQCDGTGIVCTNDDFEECICMKVFRYAKALIVARIPRAYWTLSLSKMTKVDAHYRKFVQMYLQRFDTALEKGLGVFFLGVNGIGKTALACEIAKTALMRQKSVLYITAQYYIDTLYVTDDAVAPFLDRDVIIFDELDKAYIKEGSTFVPRKVEDFLRRSLSAGAVIILCTNMNEESSDPNEETIATTFGESLVSMLKRQIKFVHMDGEDVSNSLHSGWMSRLKEDYDFFSPDLVKAAKLYSARRASLGKVR